MNHSACYPIANISDYETDYKSWNYAFPLKPIRNSIPKRVKSVDFPSPIKRLVGIGKGSGISGDKSRATPFKSREAYIKWTRDNRAVCCLESAWRFYLLPQSTEMCPRMFTWTRFCRKSSLLSRARETHPSWMPRDKYYRFDIQDYWQAEIPR